MCNKHNKSCNKTIPCASCLKAGHECIPQDDEMIKRARVLMGMLAKGYIEHVDLGFYFMHSNANYHHHKVFMKRKDVMDCGKRLDAMWPLIPMEQIPEPVIGKLPVELESMLEGMFKIEWHYDGKIITHISPEYKNRFGYNLKGNKSIYRKCVDTLGFDDYTMAIKMWLESISRPGKVVTYKGVAYAKEFFKPIIQTVLMVSLVWDYHHFITVTQVI